MKRESFKSRLGFLLIAAGCAIGIGNVWRFPYIAGNYGGGVFRAFLPDLSGYLGRPGSDYGTGHRTRQPQKYGQRL